MISVTKTGKIKVNTGCRHTNRIITAVRSGCVSSNKRRTTQLDREIQAIHNFFKWIFSKR